MACWTIFSHLRQWDAGTPLGVGCFSRQCRSEEEDRLGGATRVSRAGMEVVYCVGPSCPLEVTREASSPAVVY